MPHFRLLWPTGPSTATELDSSGNHNDAKRYGSVAYVPGLYGQAAQFHGQGDYFQVANNPAMQLHSTPQFSVTAYVQPATLDQQVILVHGFGLTTRASWFLAVQGGEPDATLYPGSFVFGVRSSNGIAYTGVTGKAAAGEWTHLAATYDGTTLKLYVDGVLQSSVAAPLPYNSTQNLYLGGNPGDALGWFVGLVDDVYVFNQALTDDEGKLVLEGPFEPQLAHQAHPAHRATDVPRDTAFSWTAGQFAATHDVYLGQTFADVNEASRTKPGACLVSQGQTGTAYTPATVFDFGQTYYWRVDEVNQAPSGTILKGRVWSFTVEPHSYPLTTGITATASGSQLNEGPEKTIDGSGLTGDLHGTLLTTMWLSLGPSPVWIQYQFDKVYKLDKLLVWNSNTSLETSGLTSFGAKDVKVEYSTDATTWKTLANVPQFAKAPGTPDYAANTTVNFGGVMARCVKLTINSTWNGAAPSPTSGLSEVRFYCAPRRRERRSRRREPRTKASRPC